MKIIEQFFLSICAWRDGKQLVKRSALEFFGCKKNISIKENTVWVELNLVNGLSKLNFPQRGNSEESPDEKQERLDDISRELQYNLRDVPKYFYEFHSYGVEPMKALLKARTLCLMMVIESYWRADENLERIYKALQLQKVQGELRCKSIKEFYFKARWFMRMGLFTGILMSETRWSR